MAGTVLSEHNHPGVRSSANKFAPLRCAFLEGWSMRGSNEFEFCCAAPRAATIDGRLPRRRARSWTGVRSAAAAIHWLASDRLDLGVQIA